jgi:hypothetical protein
MWHVEAAWKRQDDGLKDSIMEESEKRGGVHCGSGCNLATGETDCCEKFDTKQAALKFKAWLKKNDLKTRLIEE